MGLRHSILGFNQEEVLKLKKTITKEVRGEVKQVELKLDVTDLLIINHLADFPNRKKVTKIILDDKIFFWVSYNTIIEELPIIDIKKQALSDRLAKMVELGILERRIQTYGSSANMTFFRIDDLYERLKYKDYSNSQTQDVSYSTTTSCNSQTQDVNNIVNNNIVNIEKEDTKVSKKEYENEFVERMYKLYPTQCPCRNVSLGKCSKDKDRIRKLLKTYSMEQIENVIKNEVETKYGKSWMQNFSTFLNNFPDPNCIDFGAAEQKIHEDNDKLVINGVEYR